MAKKRALAIIVFLALVVWGITPAMADLVSGEPGGEPTTPQYPSYALVYNAQHYYSIAYWENIIEAIQQPGGFSQILNVEPGEPYNVIVDFAGQDPGIKSLEVDVAGNNCTYDLADFKSTPISISFAAEQSTATLEMAPYVASTAVPVPPTLLLLGSGLMGLVIFRRKIRP